MWEEYQRSALEFEILSMRQESAAWRQRLAERGVGLAGLATLAAGVAASRIEVEFPPSPFTLVALGVVVGCSQFALRSLHASYHNFIDAQALYPEWWRGL